MQEIQQELRRFLDGSIELHQFEDFFVPRFWDIENSGDDIAAELAAGIHILLAEYSRGDRPLTSLREQLTQIARQPVEAQTL